MKLVVFYKDKCLGEFQVDDKILKELKEMNKTLSSIRTFLIAEAQLTKSILLEIQQIKRKMEVKYD